MLKLSPFIVETLASVLSPGAWGVEYNLGVHKRAWLLVGFSQEAAPVFVAAGVVSYPDLFANYIVKLGGVFLRCCCDDKGLILKCSLTEDRQSYHCLSKNIEQVVGCGKHHGEALQFP